MEPNQNNPQRKIVFNGPGMSFGSPSTNPANTTPHTMMPPVGPMPGQPKVSSEPLTPSTNPNPNPAFRSFAHDIKSNVSEKGVSMAQIVMDEERRRQAAGATAEDYQEAEQKSGVLKMVLIIIGIIAIVGGGIALYITFRSNTPVVVIPIAQDYSPIRAQKVAALELRDGYKNTLLEAARGVGATRIPEETFVELKLMETVGTTSVPVGFNRLMTILDGRIPDELLRSAQDTYVLGVYGGASANIPFVLFSVDSYENGYAGMKEWEQSILGDIGGMFIDQETLSPIIASSTPSLFQDKVYYNKDTRAVFGIDRKPLLLWAIVNRTQIIITRDGETLNALIKRMTLENVTR